MFVLSSVVGETLNLVWLIYSEVKVNFPEAIVVAKLPGVCWHSGIALFPFKN